MDVMITVNGDACSMADVCRFFGIKLATFRAEWAQLTPNDKAQLRNGIGDGTLTY